MRSHRSGVVFGGGAVLLFVTALMFVMVVTPIGNRAAEAQETATARQAATTVSDILGAGGPGTWLILLLGFSAVVVTAIGAVAVRRERPWPHWQGLVHGLGEAAFLAGLCSAVLGMIQGFGAITRLGAAVTPADLSSGFGVALISVLFGALVALLALICAGVLRLSEPARGEGVE